MKIFDFIVYIYQQKKYFLDIVVSVLSFMYIDCCLPLKYKFKSNNNDPHHSVLLIQMVLMLSFICTNISFEAFSRESDPKFSYFEDRNLKYLPLTFLCNVNIVDFFCYTCVILLFSHTRDKRKLNIFVSLL